MTLTFDLSSENWHTPLTRAMGNIYTNFDFSVFFVFELRAHTGQTDRRTDEQDSVVRVSTWWTERDNQLPGNVVVIWIRCENNMQHRAVRLVFSAGGVSYIINF